MILSRHAFLEEARSVTLLLALGAKARSLSSLACNTLRVEVIDRLRVVEVRSGTRHCGTSLDTFTISILLHRILTRRQGLDVRYDNLIHDFILTAERRVADG